MPQQARRSNRFPLVSPASLTLNGPDATFSLLLDGRTADDVFPAFYRANSRWRIEELARATGLRVEEFRLIVSDAMFAPVPPLAVLELLWLRLLMTRPLRPLRTNIIAVLTKESRGTPGVPSG